MSDHATAPAAAAGAAETAGKRLVILVHGFGSSPDCWSKLLELLRAAPEIRRAFELECFAYPTQWFEFNLLRRLPSLPQVARALAELLTEKRFQCEEMTLVGHSQGGLVIQRCLVDLLHHTQGETVLEGIRQVITIATPYLGSTTLSGARKVLSHFYFFNPQERSLRVLNEEIDQLRREVEEKIVRADRRTPETWPIAVQCFYGLRDRIVPEASARGPFPSVASLDGDHFGVIRPDGPDDERYRKLLDALLAPAGHPRIWEIDLYGTEIEVEPCADREQLVRFGGKEKRIRCESFGRVSRYVTFSRKNQCAERFEIAYRTRNDGGIKPRTSGENEAEPRLLADYFDYGTEYHYKFTPRPGETFSLEVEVWKGFEDGHRDVHFHLGHRSRCRRYRLRLNLAPYLRSGYAITAEPTLYFHARDPGDHQLCEKRDSGRVILPRVDAERGVWDWQLENLIEGVVDVVWDVGKATSGDAAAAHVGGVGT